MTDVWNAAAEGLAGEALRAVQLEKLRALIDRVWEKSPYYREKLEKAGFDPAEFTSLEDFVRVPFFDKYEERESQARSMSEEGHPLGMHITCDIRDVNRMSASSGTTGTPSFQGIPRATAPALTKISHACCTGWASGPATGFSTLAS